MYRSHFPFLCIDRKVPFFMYRSTASCLMYRSRIYFFAYQSKAPFFMYRSEASFLYIFPMLLVPCLDPRPPFHVTIHVSSQDFFLMYRSRACFGCIDPRLLFSYIFKKRCHGSIHKKETLDLYIKKDALDRYTKKTLNQYKKKDASDRYMKKRSTRSIHEKKEP